MGCRGSDRTMSWTSHPGLNTPFAGDTGDIWTAPHANDVEACKRHCESKGYNALLHHGLPGLKIVEFKKFSHNITKFDCSHCPYANPVFYIYERPRMKPQKQPQLASAPRKNRSTI